MKGGRTDYKGWLKWREEYFKVKDVGEHKNLGASAVGDLKNKKPSKLKKKPSSKKITKKRLEEGAVNDSIRTTKAEYLRYHTKTVAVVNDRGEYEIKPTKYCEQGDTVWVLENDNTFTKTKIY